MMEHLDDLFPALNCWHFRLSLNDIYRMRYLRALEKTLQNKLILLKTQSGSKEDDILREKWVLHTVRQEIRKRERMALLSEFSIQ